MMRYAAVVLLAVLVACGDTKKKDVPPPAIVEDTISDGSPCALSDDVCWDSVMTASDTSQPTSDIRPLAAPVTAIVRDVSFTEVKYKQDTSLYRIRYTLNKEPAKNDSIRVRFLRSASTGVTAVTQARWRTSRAGTAEFKTPRIYGKSVGYQACVNVRRTKRDLTAVCKSWKTNWVDTTPPVPDTVVVDSTLAVIGIDVKPDSLEIRSGQKQQFCAFVRFANGKIAQRARDRGLEYCDWVYPLYSPVARAVSPKQQTVADAVCVKWVAEGGTITAELCGTPPSGGTSS